MIVISARNRDIITEGSEADITRDLKYFLSLTYQDNELWRIFNDAMRSVVEEVNEEGTHEL